MKKKVEKIDYLNSNNLIPSLSNTWILGFTEAEGCFTLSLLNNSNAFRIRFILSQKGAINLPILSQFILLFGALFIHTSHVPIIQLNVRSIAKHKLNEGA